VNLKVCKEQVIVRYKVQKEMEPEAEMDEDNLAKMTEYMQKGEKISEFW
jgi:hypothetical protein